MTGRPLLRDSERRARLAHRHRLIPAARCDDVAELARALCGFHSSDPVTVYLSAAQRMAHGSVAAIEHALYEQRCIVRHHAMRRTLWVLPLELAMAAHASITNSLVKRERHRIAAGLVASAMSVTPHDWIDDACADLLRALAEREEASTRELGAALPRLTVPITLGANSAAPTAVPAHTRLLQLLGLVGAIIRTRPIGTWVSGQYRWALSTTWTRRAWSDEALPAKAAAEAAVVDAYVRAYGPVTTRDVQWWTGWSKGVALRALKASRAIEIDTEQGPAHIASDDLVLEGTAPPWVALLPSLDSTAMGWKDRGWYVSDALATEVFDRSGNAGPTIWADGQIVGGWAQRGDGSIATELAAPLTPGHRRMLADEIERVQALVGDVRFHVRFPSPMARRLAQ